MASACSRETWRWAKLRSACVWLRVALRLLHLGQERAQVEHVKRLAGGDFLTGTEQPLLDIACDAAAHIHHVAGVRLRGVLGVNVGSGGLGLRDLNGRRRCLRGYFLRPFGPATQKVCEAWDQENY